MNARAKLEHYTPAQWHTIDSAVEKAARTTHPGIRRERPHGLTPEDRRFLITCRSIYQTMVVVASTPRSRPTPQARKRMLRIAWLSGELRKEIGRINELENSRLLTACFERDLLVLERYAKRIEHVCWTAEQNLLDECGAIVVLGTSSRGLKPRYWFTPLGTYYLDVLAVWIQIGGELKYSRGRAPARALGGPLIDFIEAVANPILGDFALKTASLQDVIDLARRGVFRWH